MFQPFGLKMGYQPEGLERWIITKGQNSSSPSGSIVYTFANIPTPIGSGGLSNEISPTTPQFI
jgi:hypothetical protein